jgi:para-nitrobenzyl esterase
MSMYRNVETKAGTVRGRVRDGITEFLGIPYAGSPVGPMRFRPATPVERWSGVRDALEFGATVPNPGYAPPFDSLVDNPTIAGTDVLNLNIWVPAHAAHAPVMVYIHGGAFTHGSNAIPVCRGTAFARDGVVLVAMNYRIGAEGFLLPEDGTPNLGLLDQVAALRWVRDNVAAFGGDPTNVTVFGESAGAMSIGALLAMPAAEGLFRRAIMQSGAGHNAISLENGRFLTKWIADYLRVAATVEGLSAVCNKALMKAVAAQAASTLFRNGPPWLKIDTSRNLQPVIDGTVLPDLPVRRPRKDVEVLIGSNRDERRFWLVPTGATEQIDAGLVRRSASAYGLPDTAVERYQAEQSDSPPGFWLADLQSDGRYRIPALRLAEALGGQAHVYEFAWRSPRFNGRLGACHAIERGFVFDTLADCVPMVGDSPPQHLATTMHQAWVEFARNGDPGWAPYGLDRNVRLFDTRASTIRGLREGTRELWEGIL